MQLHDRNGYGDAQGGHGSGARVSAKIAVHHAYVKLTIYSPRSQHNLAKPVERYGHDLIMSRKIMDVGPLSVSFCVPVIYLFQLASFAVVACISVFLASAHCFVHSYPLCLGCDLEWLLYQSGYDVGRP
jgi:hypothetical protein